MFCTLETEITYFREEPLCSWIVSGLCRLGVGELDQICTFSLLSAPARQICSMQEREEFLLSSH